MGGEQAERVRAAFGARVFLSYRKKDRRLAQGVMRAVHADSRHACVAVWYDEFLVPGEHFDNYSNLAKQYPLVERYLKMRDLIKRRL